MNLEEILFENADTEVIISNIESSKDSVMHRLAIYESLENTKNDYQTALERIEQKKNEMLEEFAKNNEEFRQLLEDSQKVSLDIEEVKQEQETLKTEILTFQRDAYADSEDNKSLTYNKVTATYVLPTEKNSFDLKKFREEQTDFWNDNQDILGTYAKITPVSDYVKLTIK